MKSIIIGAAALAACVSLSACSAISGGNPTAMLDTLGKNYAHCDRTVTYNAQVGPLNTASGASISGTVRCPPKVSVEPAVPIREPEG